MSKRKHTRIRARNLRLRKALPRAGKALQRAPEAHKELSDYSPEQRREMIYSLLQVYSADAAAPELDPWKWSSKTLQIYRKLWHRVGQLGFDRRDILSPGEAEERIERALMVYLLEDVDLSGFAA